MKIVNHTAVICILIVTHLRAQTPARPAQVDTQASPDNPSITNTVAFIKQVYIDQGPLNFQQFGEDLTVQPLDLKVSTIDPCQVTLNLTFPNPKFNITRKLDLSKVDPRTIQLLPSAAYNKKVHANKSDMWSGTSPETFVIILHQSLPAEAPSNDRDPLVGRFFEQSLALRVAKAWIHAAALCGGGV